MILSAIRDTNTFVASCVPSKTDTTSSFVFANGNTSCPKFQFHFHSNYGLQNLHLLLSRQRLCMEPGKPSAQRPSRMVFNFIQLRLVVGFKMTPTTMCNGSSVAVADEQNPCHILKPLESIDISGLAGVLGHFLLLTLLAYPGIKWHSFDPESSRKGSKSRGLIPFYYPPLATRFSSACASSKPRWV